MADARNRPACQRRRSSISSLTVTVAGHITNEAGKPVRGVSVQALKSSYPRGRRELHDVAHAATNDAGEYRIPSLTPGKYYVRAKPPASLKAKPGTISRTCLFIIRLRMTQGIPLLWYFARERILQELI